MLGTPTSVQPEADKSNLIPQKRSRQQSFTDTLVSQSIPKIQKLDQLEILYNSMVNQHQKYLECEAEWRKMRDSLTFIKSPKAGVE